MPVLTQTKIDGISYEVYDIRTNQKIKEVSSYKAVRGIIKFSILMGVDADLKIYANGKDITESVHEDIARGN